MTSPMRYMSADDQGDRLSRHAARKYHGDVATGYDAKRMASPKWVAEQGIIEDMLKGLKTGLWHPEFKPAVVDIPVGTGRFIPFYESQGYCWHGLDVSVDMLKQAAAKTQNRQKARLEQGDVRKLELPDGYCQAAVMCRLTRWLSEPDCQQAMKELQRIARERIVFTARVRNHPYAKPYGLFTSVLDGWQIHRDEEADGPDYRVIELRKT